MPTYEYKCEKCGKHWDTEQKITDKPLKQCPRCKAKSAKRLISPNNFILKGEKWANKEGY
jgi:putative FmdB family regulatory protein